MNKWKLVSLIATFIILLSSGIFLLTADGIFGFAKNDLGNEDTNKEIFEDSNGVALTGTFSCSFEVQAQREDGVSLNYPSTNITLSVNYSYTVTFKQDDLAGQTVTHRVFDYTFTMPDYTPATITGFSNVKKEYVVESQSSNRKDWATTFSGGSIDAALTASDVENMNIVLYFTYKDSAYPIVSRTTYVRNGNSGYTAYAYATDNVGVTRCRFPTWTLLNDQDDIVWHEGTSGNWTVNGQTYNWRCEIKVSEHYNQYEVYRTHIYPYDAAGNFSSIALEDVPMTKHYLYVKGLLNEKWTLMGGAFYASCDIYVNGAKVETMNDFFSGQYLYGTTYEIKNVKYEDEIKFNGVTSSSAPLSGTLTSNMSIELSFSSKTWNDFAASSFAGGSGTVSNPYIIKTAEQLAKVAKDSESKDYDDKHYRLAANINLSAHEWSPIGNRKSYYFRGVFNGDFYNIYGLKIKRVENNATGLFSSVGYGGAGVVRNLIMESPQISLGDKVGAIVGLLDNNGMVENCIVRLASLTATGTGHVGGVVGWLWNSNIKCCQVQYSSMVGDAAGGLFGYQGGGGKSTVTDNGCFQNSMFGGSPGLLYGGYNSSATMNFSGSYAEGSVGLTGRVMYGDSSAWGNWTYSPNLNDGYPVQKPLFHIGGVSGSENVYNYLLNKLNLILDMDKYMAWQNEQLAAHSRTQYNMTKDAKGVYAWSGDTAGYYDNGFKHFYYKPGTLVTGGTYKLSYQSKNARTDTKGTTAIFLTGSYTTVSGAMAYTNSQEWGSYEETFTVTDASNFSFRFGYANVGLTYFKDIRLERIS